MITLNATTKSLEIKLGGAKTTNELTFTASYSDISTVDFTLTGQGEQDGVTNGATAVTALTAPGASTSRVLKALTIHNTDTVVQTVTLQYNNNTTIRPISTQVIQAGQTLQYNDKSGLTFANQAGVVPNPIVQSLLFTDATYDIGGSASTFRPRDLFLSRNALIGGTALITGVATLTAQPILSSLTASLPVFTDGSKGLVSNAMTGTGNVVMSAAPTLTGNLTLGTVTSGVWNAGAVTSSGLLTVNGYGTHTIEAGGNGPLLLDIKNTTSGTAAFVGIEVISSTSVTGGFYTFSNGYTSSSINLANGSTFYTDGAGGFSIGSINASGTIRLYSGGTTLRATLQTAGTWTWAAYGVGTITSDASGNLTSVSDERLKTGLVPFTVGLRAVLGISPISHRYSLASGLDTANLYTGFSAQNVMQYIPQAVGKGPDGFYTFNDRPVLAATVNAIKELQTEIDELRALHSLPVYSRTMTKNVGEAGIIVSAQRPK
jgi:hypothetical protein